MSASYEVIAALREPRRDWQSVLDWLRALRPRDVEILEEAP